MFCFLRLSEKLLALSSLAYKDLVEGMSELQKTEKSVKRLLNKIESMISSDSSLKSSTEEESELPSLEEILNPQEQPKKVIDESNRRINKMPVLPLIPSVESINLFFDILSIRVSDLSTALLKYKVIQYFHPSSLNKLTNNQQQVEEENSVISTLLITSESDDILKLNQKRFGILCEIIEKWDQWISNHSTIPILTKNSSKEGTISVVNIELIQQLVTTIFELNSEFDCKYLTSFFEAKNLDSIGLLVIIYLYLYNSTLKVQENLPTHMEFIEWINLIIPHEISSNNITNEQDNEELKLKGIIIPSEIYSFLLDCTNGRDYYILFF